MIRTFSREAMDSIRQATDIRRLALKLPDAKGTIRGDTPLPVRCLWHDERTPSLMVYRDHYHCFGCAASGDLFRWLERVQGVRFPEAVRMAGAMAGIDPDAPEGQDEGDHAPSPRIHYPKEEILFWLAGQPAECRSEVQSAGWKAVCREWINRSSHEDHRKYVKYKKFMERVALALGPEGAEDEPEVPVGQRKRSSPSGLKPGGPLKEVEAYRYEDETGKPLYEVVRCLLPDGSKTFIQRLPGGNCQRNCDSSGRGRPSGHRRGIGDVPRVPYRLPQLLQAKTIFLVEGEKDVHTLERWGVPASCNPGGSGSGQLYRGWRKWFEGRNIVILPDNDAAGRGHAATVAAALYGCGRMKIVILPGLPRKGDVSDWAAAGGTFAEFLRIVKATGEL